MQSVRSLLVRIYVEVREGDEQACMQAIRTYTAHHGVGVSVYESMFLVGNNSTPIRVLELINDSPFDRLEQVRGHAIALAEALRKACKQGRVAVQCFQGGTTWQVDDANTG